MKGWIAWALSTGLGLVTLQALASREAPGRIGELFDDANRLVQAVLDPSKPAIPDHSLPPKALGTTIPKTPTAATGGGTGTTTTTTTPRLPVSRPAYF